MRGRAVYAQHCINCHGSTAKGTERGPDLIRSAVVLRDRLGNGIGPAIKPSASHQAALTRRAGRGPLALPAPAHRVHRHQSQRARAAQRAHRRPRGRARVLPRRGHAAARVIRQTGDLEGLARRITDPVDLQQRWLFPDAAPRVAEAGRGHGRGGKTTVAARSCGSTTSPCRCGCRLARTTRSTAGPA